MLIQSQTVALETVTATSDTTAVLLPDNMPPVKAIMLNATEIAGTSPTFAVVLQTSLDGATWYELDTFATTSGTSDQQQIIFASAFARPDLMPYCRASVTVGGTGGPTALLQVSLLVEAT